ncbi:MAG: DUF2520 domain-containing protein [Proteobacteria bacterium]|jgi:predicted short-subunit dehydrogenase-like oxidoreductase (DUF2520 family)|nr:DUF2520 domain-containing protein [Pseudomonadota bacterium]
MKKQKVGFIGAGKVGTALATTLFKGGYPVVAVANNNISVSEKLADLVPGCHVFKTAQEVANTAEHVFITTPDDSIPTVASELTWRPEQNVVHCSGAASIDILDPAKKSGAMVGSFHPCQAFASVDQAIKNLPGSTFAIEAQGPLLDILKEMASTIGCDWIVLKPGNKALYHAAAVFASNYFVTLLKVATDLFQNFDVPTAQSTKVLMPLIQGNIKNINTIGLPSCLTGPIARGDVSTIEKHIYALNKKEPSLLKIYAELGLQTIPIALEKGTLDEKVSETLQILLKKAIGARS